MKNILFLLLPLSLFAVLEIKPVDIGSKAGFTGSMGASLETKRGNSEIDVYKADVKIQYDNNYSMATWLQYNKSYAKASNVENVNNATLHLRHLHKLLEDYLIVEFFAQAQQDKFKSINDRNLAGAGLRYRKKIPNELGTLYFGLGAYYEYLNYLNSLLDPNERNNRLNSYIAYNVSFTKDASLTYIGYYQPRFNYFEDYYISQQIEVKVRVYQKLYLSFKIEFDEDTIPAANRKNSDFSQVTSFLYKF